MTSRQCWFAVSVFILVLSIITTVLTQKTDANLNPKMKLIIDSDMGSDDAMAVFYLLRAEKYAELENNTSGPEILAITCVHGNTALKNAVVNIFRVLKEVNRLDIPVYKGAENSLVKTPQSDYYFGQDGFGDVAWPDLPPEDLIQDENAVNALIRLVEENPGEITLLALGPLTNIALACKIHPNFLKKLRKLVILGGSVNGRGNILPGVEFNFYMDPEATYIVLNGTEFHKNSILLVPWETALYANIHQEWRKITLGELNSPEIKFMNKIEHTENCEDNEMWPCSDVVAAAITLNECLAGSIKSYGVSAITEGQLKGGIAVDYFNIKKSKQKIDIATELDVQEFLTSLIYHFS